MRMFPTHCLVGACGKERGGWNYIHVFAACLVFVGYSHQIEVEEKL